MELQCTYTTKPVSLSAISHVLLFAAESLPININYFTVHLGYGSEYKNQRPANKSEDYGRQPYNGSCNPASCYSKLKNLQQRGS